MQTEKYIRRIFEITAVRVTEENMQEIADWCGGTITTNENSSQKEKHIKVTVLPAPPTERLSMAFVGDWVLNTPRGYKVYTDSAFAKNFTQSL